jgi:hypothetical protein
MADLARFALKTGVCAAKFFLFLIVTGFRGFSNLFQFKSLGNNERDKFKL